MNDMEYRSKRPRAAKLALICISSFLLLAPTAHAAEAWHSSTIRSVYPLSDGNFVLIFDAQSAQCTNATSPKYHYVAVGQNGVTTDGIKALLATALAAAAQRLTVTIAFEGASSACYINRLSVLYN